MIVLLTYLGLFPGCWFVLRMFSPRKPRPVFGDIAAIRPNRWAQVLSIIAVLVIWVALPARVWCRCMCPARFWDRPALTMALTVLMAQPRGE